MNLEIIPPLLFPLTDSSPVFTPLICRIGKLGRNQLHWIPSLRPFFFRSTRPLSVATASSAASAASNFFFLPRSSVLLTWSNSCHPNYQCGFQCLHMTCQFSAYPASQDLDLSELNLRRLLFFSTASSMKNVSIITIPPIMKLQCLLIVHFKFLFPAVKNA